jgi:hypothetical protein
MGFKNITWKKINTYMKKAGLLNGENLPLGRTLIEDEKYYGKEMLELGCQIIRGNTITPHTNIACEYFNSIGIKCLSIDLQKCGKAIIIDLREPMPEYFHNRFDIITNSGTTEHITPINGQYVSFKNIHDCAKNGGIMMHFVPIKDKSNPAHSPFFYDCKFFERLAELNNYEIIAIEEYGRARRDQYCAICLRKINDDDFTTEKDKFLEFIYKV